jgi:hypothetical protein
MKTAKNILLLIFALFINFAAYMFFIYEAEPVETAPCTQTADFDEDNLIDWDYFLEKWGKNKNYPEAFEKQILMALSHFSELSDVKISFIEAPISTTMNCRPEILSLFQNARTYIIRINNKIDFEGILLEDVPFKAQIGIIGHELAHVLDYEAGSMLRVIKRGIDYALPSSKKNFEHEIDLLTIKKGLGYQLADWAEYSMFLSDKASDDYKRFKQTVYMNPGDMYEIFSELDCYESI